MRRALTMIAKNLPFLTKKIAFFTALYAQQRYFPFANVLSCSSSNNALRQHICTVESTTIKVKSNGRVVGYAYCFANNYLVAVSDELLQRKRNTTYQYYLGEQKIKGTFKVVGNYQNLVFIECTLIDNLRPINADLSRPSSYTDVQIVQKKDFISIKNGYFITEDSGYGIIDGEGEIGSLVVSSQGIRGITVQIGQQVQKGFLRMIEWRHLPSILNYVKGKPLHLGISAQALENHEGISVVRIAPNSPFKNDIMMGDVILSANGHQFRSPQSFQRVCIESYGEVELTILREGKKIQIKVHL